MATIKQIEANRRNALKSTGPKTPEGKAAVRLNALRDGLRARTVVLPGEREEDFQRLCDALQAEWQPQTETEQIYVEQMAIAQWKLARSEVAESSLTRQDISAPVQIPLLERIWQNQRRLERSFVSAQRELQRLRDARRRPAAESAEPARPDSALPQPLSDSPVPPIVPGQLIGADPGPRSVEFRCPVPADVALEPSPC